MAGMHWNRSGGFTLVELMLVVAIMGVLASIGIPAFVNYQLTSKRSEAFANLAALAKAQKAYYAEFNGFVSVASEPGFTLGESPSGIKRDKTPVDTAFADVGWVPDGDVFFDYDTSTPDDPLLGSCACVDGCFTATAYGDLDGDGLLSMMIYTHPDPLGQFCGSGQAGDRAPPQTNGDYQFDEVSRIILADDF